MTEGSPPIRPSPPPSLGWNATELIIEAQPMHALPSPMTTSVSSPLDAIDNFPWFSRIGPALHFALSGAARDSMRA